MRFLKIKDGRSCVIRIDLVKGLTVMMQKWEEIITGIESLRRQVVTSRAQPEMYNDYIVQERKQKTKFRPMNMFLTIWWGENEGLTVKLHVFSQWSKPHLKFSFFFFMSGQHSSLNLRRMVWRFLKNRTMNLWPSNCTTSVYSKDTKKLIQRSTCIWSL